MALDPSIASKFMALAKARNKFNLGIHKEIQRDKARYERQQYEAAQSGNNGMWATAASGASIGGMFGPVGAGIGALGGLVVGGATEAYQNKKTAEQYGKKGYGWGDAFSDLGRPPTMQESGMLLMAGGQQAARHLAAQPVAARTSAQPLGKYTDLPYMYTPETMLSQNMPQPINSFPVTPQQQGYRDPTTGQWITASPLLAP